MICAGLLGLVLAGSLYADRKDRLPQIVHREELGRLAEERGFKVGAELGVERGRFATEILKQWPSVETYYAVDLWQPITKDQDSTSDGISYFKDENEGDKVFHNVRKKLGHWEASRGKPGTVRYLRGYTSNAVNQVEDGSLDFIYIDAQHKYEKVKEDLVDWWPKLKIGGIFAGHDYMYNPVWEDENSPTGVSIGKAVDEFAQSVGHTLMTTTEPVTCPNCLSHWAKDVGCEFPDCMYPVTKYPYNRSWYFMK